MVVAQKTKEDEITEIDSLLLTRNLLRIAIFNISYIRGLFPEKYFNDKSVPALEMKIKKLMPMDAESRRLIDWMEKGVYDALQKKYLKTLLFCICKEIEGPMIEEYAFSFSYPNSNSEEVTMNVNRIGNKKNGAIFKSNTTEITPDQMRSSACKMVRTLVQLMRTLDQMPDERTILMKLLYYDDVTPADYEPPFFRSCSENETNSTWAKNPLKMEVGNVNSKHVVLALKVKSILDPCDDENDELPEDDASLGADSVHEDNSSSDDDDDEVHPSRDDQYIIVPIGEKRVSEDTDMHSEDDTQDPVHEEEQIACVKNWVASRHINTVDLTDILSNFPDISVAFAEDITERLSSEGFLSKVGKDSFTINRELSPNTCAVKQELDMQEAPQTKESHRNGDEDYMYMKALYHVLPLDYVTLAKLQSKLEGEANHTMVRKLIDRMVRDGYIQNSGNRKLGKRVIHSESSNKKLMEVKKALESKPMEMETDEQPFEFDATDMLPNGRNLNDGSTCGGLYSIGSDLTRTRGRSETHQNGSIRSAREQANTPTSKADPIASLESGTLGKGGRVSCEGDDIRSSQDKRSRRASTVKEPILQYVKRQKSQPRE